ncbi:MAG: preprotein translocase subunit YajC [Planctomycetota bacterium]|jgi:preprotein translocase subunit YajC
MNNLYILAAAADEAAEGELISSESTEGVAETVTVQDGSNTAATKDDVTTRPPVSPLMQYLPLIMIFVVMYLFLFRGPKKKQKQHQQMIQSLRRNDKVRTIGGILGTVIDVKDDEITLKVDESNNTKIRVTPGSISKSLSDSIE